MHRTTELPLGNVAIQLGDERLIGPLGGKLPPHQQQLEIGKFGAQQGEGVQ
ncbi:hypothetical protein D3C78_1707770 [compost metagenome]